jgi:hypothetical protein
MLTAAEEARKWSILSNKTRVMISLKKTGELNSRVFLLLSSDVWHSICWTGF